MLTFAIATFFTLSLIGALLVIGMMFFGYRERILKVVLDGLDKENDRPMTVSQPYRHRTIKPRQMVQKHRTLRPTPMRVAA